MAALHTEATKKKPRKSQTKFLMQATLKKCQISQIWRQKTKTGNPDVDLTCYIINNRFLFV